MNENTQTIELHEALVIHPGDKLIVRYEQTVSLQQAAEIRTLILDRLPELADAIVIIADQIAAVRNESVAA